MNIGRRGCLSLKSLSLSVGLWRKTRKFPSKSTVKSFKNFPSEIPISFKTRWKFEIRETSRKCMYYVLISLSLMVNWTRQIRHRAAGDGDGFCLLRGQNNLKCTHSTAKAGNLFLLSNWVQENVVMPQLPNSPSFPKLTRGNKNKMRIDDNNFLAFPSLSSSYFFSINGIIPRCIGHF